jgi:hypothetical protein
MRDHAMVDLGTMTIGPFTAACLLLLATGAAKLRHPQGAVRALGAAGLPAPSWSGRALGAAEVALATAALVGGTPVAGVAVGLLYGGFAIVAARLRARAATTSCGCFGDHDAPAALPHVVLDAALAVGALAWSLDPTGTMRAGLDGQPLAGVPFLVLCALLARLVATAMATLGPLDRALRSGSEAPTA